MFFCPEFGQKNGVADRTRTDGLLGHTRGRQPEASRSGATATTSQAQEVRDSVRCNASAGLREARRSDDFLPKVYFQGKKIGDTPKRTSVITTKKNGVADRTRTDGLLGHTRGRQPEASRSGATATTSQAQEVRDSVRCNASAGLREARRSDDFLPKVYFQGKKIGDTPKRTSVITTKKNGVADRTRTDGLLGHNQTL